MSFLARRVAGRFPTWVLWLLLAVEGVVRLVVAVLRLPFGVPVLVLLGAVIYVGASYGWLVAGVMVGSWIVGVGLAVALVTWARPGVAAGWWRARRYRRAWDDAMVGCKLDRAGVIPTLMSCQSNRAGVDRLLVHVAPGQLVADWRDAAPRVAGALGVRSIRVRSTGPRDVMLLVRWREIRARDEVSPAVAELELVEASLPEPTELDELEPAPTEMPRGAFPRSRR